MVASLPQLKWLDGKEITKSERILASQVHVHVHILCVAVNGSLVMTGLVRSCAQVLAELTESIKKQQEEYELKQVRTLYICSHALSQ